MTPNLPLACTVRSCGLGLLQHGRALVCAAGHSYDIARRGYVNLLQPQDRRSRTAGDAPEAVRARATLLDAGFGRRVLVEVIARAVGLAEPDPVVVDLGSGSGHLLGWWAQSAPIRGIGIDLSTAAAEDAARRFPRITWVVANADRRLPLLDGRVDLAVSVHGRRNVAECSRVLKSGGALVVAVPAPDDLIELRAWVGGETVERPRIEGVLQEHERYFEPIDRTSVRDRHQLGREHLLDLLRATYRGERHSATARVEALRTMDVTFASDVLVFRSTSRN